MIRALLERLGWEFIYGQDGEHRTLYLLRVPLTPGTRWGGMYLHVFMRGDVDPDCHDHPWYFWTFPLVSYLEEVMLKGGVKVGELRVTKIRNVKCFRWHHRPGAFAHRILGRTQKFMATDTRGQSIPMVKPVPGRIVTLVWHGPKRREWGFWVQDRWVPWRQYVYGIHDRA